MTDQFDQFPQTINFTRSGDQAALFAALALARGQFAPIIRDKTVKVTPRQGQPYTFTYAPLERVQDATAPALAANGLTVLQPFYSLSQGGWVVHTILAHAAGGTLESLVTIRGFKRFWNNDAKEHQEAPKSPQELGSELTYIRRYSLQCMLGVNAEDDDDANGAEGNDVAPAAKTQKTPPPAPATKPAPQKPPEPKKPEPPKPASVPPQPGPEPFSEVEPPSKTEPAPPLDDEAPFEQPEAAPAAHPNDDLPRTEAQNKLLGDLFSQRRANRESVARAIRDTLGREPSSPGYPLTQKQARELIGALQINPKLGAP